MSEQIYTIKFSGYWRESEKYSVPSQPGIYCVYTSAYNTRIDTLSLHKLIYIGESENVCFRISGHEKELKWKRHLKDDEELCFNFGMVIEALDRIRYEAAMIFKHRPPENTEYVNEFPFEETSINLFGQTEFLYNEFTLSGISYIGSSLNSIH